MTFINEVILKYLKIFSLLIIIVSCSFCETPIERSLRIYNNKPYINNLSIEVSLNDSVSISKIEELHFIIINKNVESYFLDTWSLCFMSAVYDENGNHVGKYSTRHSMIDPGIPEYILIKGNSEISLTLKTDFFNNLVLEVNRNYIYDIEYYNTISKKSIAHPTFIGRVDIAPVVFRTCE